MRIRMQVSIASSTWSYQPGQVCDVPDKLARTWCKVGHAVEVPRGTPLTLRDLNLADLSAEEALARRCESCNEKRARFVFQNRGYCQQCYRAMLA